VAGVRTAQLAVDTAAVPVSAADGRARTPVSRSPAAGGRRSPDRPSLTVRRRASRSSSGELDVSGAVRPDLGIDPVVGLPW
jgi:hypothetical protein